jgi:muconate cycloisomerase
VKITAVEVHRVWVPGKEQYRMATSAHIGLRTVIVIVRTADGTVGVGEAHQAVASYSGETIDTMKAVIEQVYAPRLLGRGLYAIEELSRDMANARRGNLFARCAVEIALFDAFAKLRGVSIASLLGGPVRSRIAVSAIVGLAEPHVMAQKSAALVAAGYRTVKAKIGTGSVASDVECVREIRRTVGDDIAIRLDANAAYSLTDALQLVRHLSEFGIEHLEQPVPADHLSSMAKLTQLCAVPILADEGVHTSEDAYRLISMRAVDAIKIKLTKVGGYIAARKIIAICEAAGIKLVVGQGMCSSIEAAAEAQLATAYSGISPVGEMVGPAKLQEDLAHPGLDVSPGYIDLPSNPGIGVSLSLDRLRRYSLERPETV